MTLKNPEERAMKIASPPGLFYVCVPVQCTQRARYSALISEISFLPSM